jgi:hypothetical protein
VRKHADRSTRPSGVGDKHGRMISFRHTGDTVIVERMPIGGMLARSWERAGWSDFK